MVLKGHLQFTINAALCFGLVKAAGFFSLLCEISKGAFEISLKILKPYTAKCAGVYFCVTRPGVYAVNRSDGCVICIDLSYWSLRVI